MSLMATENFVLFATKSGKEFRFDYVITKCYDYVVTVLFYLIEFCFIWDIVLKN